MFYFEAGACDEQRGKLNVLFVFENKYKFVIWLINKSLERLAKQYKKRGLTVVCKTCSFNLALADRRKR